MTVQSGTLANHSSTVLSDALTLSDQSALDPSVLESLRKLEAAAEPGLLAEVLETFRETAREKVETMRRAARDGDRTTLGRAAHSLKGSCGMVGARRMAERCELMELWAEREACDVRSGLVMIEEERQSVLEEIKVLLRANPHSISFEGAA